MSADVACGQRNQSIAVKIRLIVSVRFAANAAQSRMMRVVEDVPKRLLLKSGEEREEKRCLGESEEMKGVVEVVEVRKKLMMRLRFTRVSVPTMKEYQHAESLLA